MNKTLLTVAAGALATLALAQMTMPADARSRHSRKGTVVTNAPNSTGGRSDRVIARGATGADTVQTNSAAGGNAGQPSRAVPQGGSSGSGSR